MPNTGFSVNGVDLDKNLVPKSYLMDRYPELANTFKTAGLWLWGANGVTGQLGDNTTITKSSPVQTVASGANWKQVSVKGNSCGAIKTDGTLWVWGGNNSLKGQLGDNTTTSRSSPVQTVAAGTNWKQVSFGQYYCGAIKTDGTLWMWGDGLYGKLGDNTNQPKSSPIQTVAAGTNWKQLSLGEYTTAAIKTDGTLWTWGFNYTGALGDNTTTNKSSPVQTVAGGTNWKQVSSGQTTAAIRDDSADFGIGTL